jgi:class 3 adenylate cyclase
MSQRDVPEYRAILTIDIEDYSIRTDAEQQVLQGALIGVLNSAVDAAGLDRHLWLTQFSGDGVLAILPHGIDVTRLMDLFLRELDAGLGGHNRRRYEQAWTRMRLRLAVHAGPVYLYGPTGWPGQHVVLPARLRDSEPVRMALAVCPGADLAVIVSSQIYRDYVTQGPGQPRPTEFREVAARVKKQSYIAYLLVPGADVHAIAELAKFDVSGPAPGPPVPAAAGESTAASGQPVRTKPKRESAASVGPIRAGGNVVTGNHIEISGGSSSYQAGGDISLSADGTGGQGDGR